MRVAELIAPHRFRICEKPAPEPGPGEIQVRVRMVGVCGSDLHNFSEGAVGDIPSEYPMVLGHEPAGIVVKTGLGASGWSPGDRAALEPAIYCYHCEHCLSGHHNVCRNLRFLSQPSDPGYFRDLVNLPVGNLLPLPAEMSLQEATLFEPLAVALHSLALAAARIGETAVIFGAGPIGLLTLAALKASGAGRVWVVDPVPHRRELARKTGADAVLDPVAVDAASEVLHDTGARGVDVAIDCAARGDSLNQAIHAARNAGRVVLTGIPSDCATPLNLHSMRRKELTLLNVRRSNHDSETALALLSEQRARFAPIITHEIAIEHIQEAFTKLERYEDGVGKIVIQI